MSHTVLEIKPIFVSHCLVVLSVTISAFNWWYSMSGTVKTCHDYCNYNFVMKRSCWVDYYRRLLMILLLFAYVTVAWLIFVCIVFFARKKKCFMLEYKYWAYRIFIINGKCNFIFSLFMKLKKKKKKKTKQRHNTVCTSNPVKTHYSARQTASHLSYSPFRFGIAW